MSNGVLCLAGYSAAYTAGVDLKAIRLAIVRERERQEMTQQQVAERAGMRQGHLSNIENVDGIEMKDLAARVLFQIIEQGLKVPLSLFFAQIEGVSAPTVAAPQNQGSPKASTDEAVPTLTADDRAVLQTLGKVIAHFADREGARQSATRRGHAPGPRDRTAQPNPRPGGDHSRDARGDRPRGRPRKR